MDRAVVTGGAGFIGANLVDRLVDDGVEVLVVDDLSTGHLARLAHARSTRRVTFHQLDVRDAALRELFRSFGPDVVFHLAAQIDVRRSVRDPVFDAEVNVGGLVNVLDASRLAGVERVVFASSGGARFGDVDQIPTPEDAPARPESPYGVSKLVADDYLAYYRRAHGLDYVSLGFSNVYGPGQDPHGEAGVVAIFIGDLLAGRTPVIYGDGRQTRDFVFVEDVTDACVRAARIGGGEYLNIGTGEETTIRELFELVRRAVGVDVEPRFAPPRPGEQRRSCLDSRRAAAALGWEPWTPLAEGIAATVAAFAG